MPDTDYDRKPDPGSLKKRADDALANRTPLAEWSLGTLVTRDGATLLAIYLGGSDKPGEILGGGFVLNMLSAQRFAADLESVLNTEIAVRGLIRESLGRALRDSRESEAKAAHDSAPCICTPPCPWDDDHRAPRCKVTP